MAKYESGRRPRPGSGRHGRPDKNSSGRRDGDYEEDDDYRDERPSYYGADKPDKHEKTSLVIFIVALVIVVGAVIATMAGAGIGVSRGKISDELGETGEKAEVRKEDARDIAASKALGDARHFDKANPYEDKEIVAEKYREVMNKYPGTPAAQEAQDKYNEVMDRRK